MRKNKLRLFSFIAIVCLLLQTFAHPIISVFAEQSPSNKADTLAERRVVLVGDLQDELGHSGEWDPAAKMTQMIYQGDGFYQLTGDLPAGSYVYKVAIGGNWDENYGEGGFNGRNIELEISEDTEVTFYYHDGTNAITDSTKYQPIETEKQPRLVGNLQPIIGEGGEWSLSESTAFLKDSTYNQIYEFSTMVPVGEYQFKIVLGDTWDDTEAYPEENYKLTVEEDSEITFTYDHNAKTVTTSGKSDSGKESASINKELLYHDTWNKAYRSPFGAIPAGEEVTLRLAAEKGDLTAANLYLKDSTSGNSLTYNMDYAGWTEVEGKGELEFWEYTFTPEQKGLYGYKFIAMDGNVIAEYGEDSGEGSIGRAVDANAGTFQLTVYDPAYQTPDWMKEAVVYQIFPDRFYNGNEKNDEAKEYARGKQPIEDKEWGELPDNPRMKDSAGYEGDGQWSNDFFGGDIAGILDKLDYLQSLGVNTLYLNPIAKAASNHKYDATDYKIVDPMFGTPEEFKAFTKELEERGMYLILDGVFNHVADDSIYFDRYKKYDTVGAYEYWSAIYDLMNEEGLSEEEATEKVTKQFINEGQGFSEYGFHNWFNIDNNKVKEEDGTEHYEYQAWWGFDSLPEFKSVAGDNVDYDSEYNNDQLVNYIFKEEDSVAKSWIFDGGSGWRLDVANEVDPQFWRVFRDEMKADEIEGAGPTLQKGEKPLILGEIWDDASKYFLGDQYDSVMNYRFERAVLDFLKNGNAAQHEADLLAVQEDYPKEAYYALMNLLGSHDTPRAVFLLGGGTSTYDRAEFDPNYNYELGKNRLKLASMIQMGYPGAPTIYYGDEAGVTGSADPDDRRTYPWGKEDQELIDHYKKIGKVRTDHQDLFAYGDLHHVYAKDDVMVFARTNDKKASLIAINRGQNDQTVKVDIEDVLPNGVEFQDQLSNVKVTSRNDQVELNISAMSGQMLIASQLPAQVRPVKDIMVTEGESEVTLSWNGDAESYAIYQTNIAGAFYKQVATSTTNQMTINDLENGRKYYYAVVAIDKEGNRSEKTYLKDAVIPHIDLTNATIENVTDLGKRTIDLSKQIVVQGKLYLDGSNTERQGIQAKLQVKQENADNWVDYEASHLGDHIFEASFLPLEATTYDYRLSISSDAGRNWITSETKKVIMEKDRSDTEKPASSVILEQPIQESGQVNLSWSIKDPIDLYMIAIYRNEELLDTFIDVNKNAYKDLAVKNGTEYQYKVVVYDQGGNKVESNSIKVTPDIVMVEVTFNVNAPKYTPLDAQITIPNSINGWSTGAWEMSRGGNVSHDWAYTVEVQEGTQITYKYVRNGSWDHEGLADHTPDNSEDDDVSYYGYGAPGTDLTVTVVNQGNNKMVIDDRILRWIDQPVVIDEPINGEEVSSDSITFKGNAIKEGILTIAGEPVPINEDMTFSHDVQLQDGENHIEVTIEPSEESKSTIFKNDGGAIEKNTKTYTYTIVKTAQDDTGSDAENEGSNSDDEDAGSEGEGNGSDNGDSDSNSEDTEPDSSSGNENSDTDENDKDADSEKDSSKENETDSKTANNNLGKEDANTNSSNNKSGEGKLPNTATNLYSLLLLAVVLIGLGVSIRVYKSRR
ncbi:alpha-amylase family glycosyl hydrolase [Bacillus carboniphilus]|uniref:Alpha-amylase family glycosyl hydrolase n=1 Tax=Bacillus carboniphilus TaxID=86663 RepID=A0ABY9JQD0_9BACI|nr:alpha-amylase family glycosyl hydrolase [Bacillus carboniphilus]WLR41605.1 alpha-amylase family glycosyl hydrolase [Bacillus carboniphilus]